MNAISFHVQWLASFNDNGTTDTTFIQISLGGFVYFHTTNQLRRQQRVVKAAVDCLLVIPTSRCNVLTIQLSQSHLWRSATNRYRCTLAERATHGHTWNTTQGFTYVRIREFTYIFCRYSIYNCCRVTLDIHCVFQGATNTSNHYLFYLIC